MAGHTVDLKLDHNITRLVGFRKRQRCLKYTEHGETTPDASLRLVVFRYCGWVRFVGCRPVDAW